MRSVLVLAGTDKAIVAARLSGMYFWEDLFWECMARAWISVFCPSDSAAGRAAARARCTQKVDLGEGFQEVFSRF